MRASMRIDTAALRRTMRRLPEKMQGAAEKSALRTGARVIAKEVKARAPKDEGDLAKSVAVVAASKEHRASGSGPIIVGFKRPAGRMAHLQEFGTAHHAAQPFFRPAIDAKGDEAIAGIAKGLAKALERASKQLAGAQGRKKFKRALK